MRKPYLSAMTDEQWAILEPLIPINRVGRPREVDMREVLNAAFYLNRSGCQWDMLPHDLPARSTVYDHFAQWQTLKPDFEGPPDVFADPTSLLSWAREAIRSGQDLQGPLARGSGEKQGGRET